MTRFFRHSGASQINLKQNQLHEFAANHALSLYAHDAVYSFIPKNACSTLRYSVALANGAIEGPDHFNWIHANNQTFRASLRELARARYAFTVLRDPFLRLASCYLDKFVEQDEPAWMFRRLVKYACLPHELTFRRFVAELKPHLRANEHWQPQLDFLVYQGYDDIFCFERFDEARAILAEKIGFIVHDARALTRHGTDQYELTEFGRCVGDVSAADLFALKRAGRVPPLREFYDPPLIAAVRQLYAADIAFYEQSCARPLFG